MHRKNWIALSVVSVLGGLSLAGARHEEGFSDESLEGTWSYVGQLGLFVPPVAEELTPSATIGQIEFDGEGGCSLRGLINTLGETVEVESTECEYSVEPSGFGTGSLRMTNAPIDAAFPYAFVIRDGGDELSILNTAFVVGAVSAKRR
jgi:hypothetical protein